MSVLLTIVSAHASAEQVKFGLFGSEHHVGYLLIALLLAFLLLARVSGRSSGPHTRPPPRHSPVSYDELARTVFSLAVGCDLEGYRGLYLAGGEVHEILGERGSDYLSARSLEVLEDALATIGAHLSRGARYNGVRLDDDDRLFMSVTCPGQQQIEIDLGTVAHLGAVVRLVFPPYTR
ncbi:MAG: hypothetical protein ABIO70_18465 [Pseudomonadota bacterium]